MPDLKWRYPSAITHVVNGVLYGEFGPEVRPKDYDVNKTTVVESSSDAFQPGDRVLANGSGLSETRDGGFSEYLRLPEDIVVPLSPGLTMREAMGIEVPLAALFENPTVRCLAKWIDDNGCEVAGQLARIVVLAIEQADRVQRSGDVLAPLLLGERQQQQRKLDVLRCGEDGYQIVRLKDVAHMDRSPMRQLRA